MVAQNPLLLINFKTYEEGTGDRGLKMAKIIEKVAAEKGANMAIAVQIAEIHRISSEVSIPVYSQHMDGIHFGSNTGWILPETIKSAGATGVILNHAEHQMEPQKLREAIDRAKELRLKTVVCANTPDSAKDVSRFSPDYIAVEPPELIGGSVSVSKARPEVITNSLKNVGQIPLLVGAGVKTKDDVRKGIQLGAAGVFVASAVMKALNPEKAVKNLAEGLNV
jgi:triosephosphate isomerase